MVSRRGVSVRSMGRGLGAGAVSRRGFSTRGVESCRGAGADVVSRRGASVRCAGGVCVSERRSPPPRSTSLARRAASAPPLSRCAGAGCSVLVCVLFVASLLRGISVVTRGTLGVRSRLGVTTPVFVFAGWLCPTRALFSRSEGEIAEPPRFRLATRSTLLGSCAR